MRCWSCAVLLEEIAKYLEWTRWCSKFGRSTIFLPQPTYGENKTIGTGRYENFRTKSDRKWKPRFSEGRFSVCCTQIVGHKSKTGTKPRFSKTGLVRKFSYRFAVRTGPGTGCTIVRPGSHSKWNIWSRQIELNIDSSNQSTFSTITQYGIRQLDTRRCPLDQFGHGEFTGDVFASSNLFRDSLVESEILHP